MKSIVEIAEITHSVVSVFRSRTAGLATVPWDPNDLNSLGVMAMTTEMVQEIKEKLLNRQPIHTEQGAEEQVFEVFVSVAVALLRAEGHVPQEAGG